MDLSDTRRAVSTTTDGNNDDELGQVMAVVVRLRELRDRGFDHQEIARRIAVDHPRTPGGGTWSAATVRQVLRVADTSEIEHRRAVGADHTAEPSPSRHRTSRPVSPQRVVTAHHPPPVKVEHSRSVDEFDASLVAAEPDPPWSTVSDVAVAGDQQPTAASRSWLGVTVGLVALLAAAGILSYLVSGSFDLTATEPGGSGRDVSDGERTAASQALLSEVADGAELSGDAQVSDGGQPVDSTIAGGGTDPADGGAEPGSRRPLIVTIDDLPEGDPTDMLSIRVEGDDGDGGEGGTPPATATIRTDGRLHVEGAFPTQAAADAFVVQASRIFGAEALVESYTIDPAAPQPTVSDVALDKPVLFEPGSTRIHPEYIPFLEACAGVLEANSYIVMSVSAYTDSWGDEQFNLELSRQRAQVIVDFYRSLDIADDQLIGAGFGEAAPVADNTSPQGREQNRRAMLQLLNIMDDQG
jgi:outer membrane protein OmpA-like peptidoglycan-associated protein